MSHNLPAISTFVDSLRRYCGLGCGQRVPGIISILADKDMNGMLDLLKSVLEPIFLFKLESDRTFEESDIAERHRCLHVYKNFAEAWTEYSLQEKNLTAPLVVGGSFLAVSQAMSVLEVCVLTYFNDRSDFSASFSPSFF